MCNETRVGLWGVAAELKDYQCCCPDETPTETYATFKRTRWQANRNPERDSYLLSFVFFEEHFYQVAYHIPHRINDHVALQMLFVRLPSQTCRAKAVAEDATE